MCSKLNSKGPGQPEKGREGQGGAGQGWAEREGQGGEGKRKVRLSLES